MDETLHVLAGLGFFAAMNGAVLASGWRVASALPLSPLDRVAAALAVAAAQIIVALTVTGACGILGLWTASVACAILTGGVFLAFRRTGTPWVRPLLAGLRMRLREDPWIAGAAAPGIALLSLVFLYAIPRPPMGFDPLDYHLTLAAHYLQSGDLSPFFFPPYFDVYSHLPISGDLFSVWAILPFGCDFLLPLVNVPFLVLIALSLFGLARDAGLGRVPATAATSALMTMPVVLFMATESYVELPLWAAFLGAVRFAILAGRTRSTATFAVAALLCGLATGIKTTGPVLVLMVFAIHAAACTADGRGGRGLLADLGRRAALVAGFVLALGAYTWARNWVLTGNPVYPFPVAIANLQLFPGVEGLPDRLSATTVLAHHEVLFRSGKLQSALVGETFSAMSGWGLGVTGACAGVLGAVLGLSAVAGFRRAWRDASWRTSLVMLLSAAAIAGLWLVLPWSGTFLAPNVRFLCPAVLLLALVALRRLAATGADGNAIVICCLAAQALSVPFAAMAVTRETGWLAAMAMAVAGLGWVALRFLRRRARVDRASDVSWTRRFATMAAVLVLCVTGIACLHEVRERDRFRSWREADRPFQSLGKHYADCAEALERTAPSGRIAVGAGNRELAFVFPLFGSHLTREVVYANVGEPDVRNHAAFPTGNPRLAPDRQAWLRNLERLRPDWLAVFANTNSDSWPEEAGWATALPGRFTRMYASPVCELYRVEAQQIK
jgi:hypothetical protein